MSLAAYLKAPVPCWKCGRTTERHLFPVWGYCTQFALPRSENEYALGDEIWWHPNPDGSVTPWAWIGTKGASAANIGDPAVRDVDCWDWVNTAPCESCLSPVGAFVFVVRENRIVEVRSVAPKDVTTTAEYIEIRPDGSSLAHPEWNDRPLTVAPD